MYQKGELVVYENQGVCKIEDIGPIRLGKTMSDRMYYTLSPIFRAGKIYVPMDSVVYMRYVISEEEADQCIEKMIVMQAEEIKSLTNKEQITQYKDTLYQYTCEGLWQMICNMKAKEKQYEQVGKKIPQQEVRLEKEAETLLYQELAIVLNISVEEVIQYIINKKAEK